MTSGVARAAESTPRSHHRLMVDSLIPVASAICRGVTSIDRFDRFLSSLSWLLFVIRQSWFVGHPIWEANSLGLPLTNHNRKSRQL